MKMNDLQRQLINAEIGKLQNLIAELEEIKRLTTINVNELQQKIDKISSEISELQKEI